MDKITSAYLHHLQAIYYKIGDRGICVDKEKLKANAEKLKKMVDINLQIASAQWGCKVFIGAANATKGNEANEVNLNASQGERALLKKMKDLGYNVPKITKKNQEGEYESNFSTGELALQKMLSENQFNFPQGDPAIRSILAVRELGKLLSSYFNARLLPQFDFSSKETLHYFVALYNVAGTLTYRRASRKHTFRFGNNAQNFPEHSDIAWLFRECLIPRPGNIFLMVDQVQAEDWPVSALSMNHQALLELRSGVDRHSGLATKIFGKLIPAKDDPAFDNAVHGMPRYLGKKTRHARNYGMRAKRMSESLAQEGKHVSIATCDTLLKMAHLADPSVDDVFHVYVQNELQNSRMLKTPFGAERMFLSARPGADNNTVFNEAYAWIPQSVVGCNTGFAVFDLETNYPQEERCIVQEGHDSIVEDVSPVHAERELHKLIKSFKRTIRFHNGIEIEIPLEAKVCSDFHTGVTLSSMDSQGLKEALEKLNEKIEKKRLSEVAA